MVKLLECVCLDNLIDLIMIKNEYQNQGLGSQFISIISNKLLEIYPTILLESFEDNDKANNFYEKNGWILDKVSFNQEIGGNKKYYYKSNY